MALTLKERCHRRLEGLKKARTPYEQEWREIASYTQPARSRFLSTDNGKLARQRNRMNSSHGMIAARTLQGGMTSGLSSPSRPWFTLTTYDDATMEDPEVRAWLEEVEKRLYAFLAHVNFYEAAKTGYLELGLFSIEACVMQEHKTDGAVCHQLTAGEYWIGLGDNLKPDTLYRRCPVTVNQAVQMFGKSVSPRISNLYAQSNLDEMCEFYHAIEPNDDRQPGILGAKGMPFRSVYWDAQDDRKEEDAILSARGYEEQPFWAPRWDTVGSDAYGNSPGMDALPDLRELQLQSKRKGEATDYHVWPEMVTSSKVKLKRQPKSVVTAASVDKDSILVPYQIPYQTIESIREDIREIEAKVDQGFYADLFMAITNMQGIQPRNVEEIAARNEEKLTQLGPVIERVNGEKLRVAIDRAFGIMSRARMIPQPPQKLAGQELKIDFVSILTQMQRMVGLGQIERTAQFISSFAAASPEVLDKLDTDAMIDEYAERAGAPPKMIRSNDEAAQLRDARQKQQAAMAAAQAAPGLAKAAKDGTDAAVAGQQLPQSIDPQAAQVAVGGPGNGQSPYEQLLPPGLAA